MDTNHQNTSAAFTNVNSTWNMQKMETQVQDHYQIPMASGIWPNYHQLLQMHHQQVPSSSSTSSSMMAPSSSSSGFLGDILGVHLEEEEEEEEPEEELGAMKEMMYKIAAMQPVDIDPATIRKPKRRNVRISDDPQSVAARHRRERISEKIRILQRLVPGGTKMDTASMLDEAIRYVKFLKRQIRLLQSTPQTQDQDQHQHQRHHPLPQPPHCIGAPTLSNPTTSTLLLTAGIGDWPFAPNMLHSSTTASPAGLGFNAGGHGHACDGSSGFNHHEVI